jgi:hypothetical protein
MGNSQLELFSDSQRAGSGADSSRRWSFFKVIRGYEKITLSIMAVGVMGIISFSLGVERGKQIVLTQLRLKAMPQDRQVDQIQKTTRKTSQPAPQSLPPENKGANILNAQELERQGYTIQLASYKNISFAQREANDLKKKGYLPVVLSKGNWVVLCVGNFSSRNKAGRLLSELRKRYSDCTIRRL